MDIAATIKKLQKGDQKAFKELVFAYSGKLMVVANIYTQNYEDAKDVLQDGFILIFQNIGKFKGLEEAALLGWMRKIVMNEALRKYKRVRYKKEVYNIDSAKEFSVEPISFDNFEKEELIREINSLPLRYKQVVCLFALEGFSHKEIAQKLNIEPSSSRATYSRAKIILQKKMNPAKIIAREIKEKIKSNLVEDKKKCV